MKTKKWCGRFYEDFQIGDIYKHPMGKTVTFAENLWFNSITHNYNSSLFHEESSSNTISNCLVLALVNGLSVIDTSQNGIVLEWEDVVFPSPLFNNETVYAETKVLFKRELKTRPSQGLVLLQTRGLTIEGKFVVVFKRTILIDKKLSSGR